MNRGIFLLIFLLLFLGCETGIIYEKNTTKISNMDSELPNGEISKNYDKDIEALVEDKSLLETVTNSVNSFSGGTIQDGLDVRSIREGKHDGFTRLVFDVYEVRDAYNPNDHGKPAKRVGHYDAEHNNDKKDIAVIISGYRRFSAPLPSFSDASIIEKIYLERYPDDSGFKFHIKLRHQVEVRVFDLKDPARLVFDIKAI